MQNLCLCLLSVYPYTKVVIQSAGIYRPSIIKTWWNFFLISKIHDWGDVLCILFILWFICCLMLVVQKALQLPVFLFTFTCNAKSFQLPMFSFSVSSMFLNGLTKVCFFLFCLRRVWPILDFLTRYVVCVQATCFRDKQ